MGLTRRKKLTPFFPSQVLDDQPHFKISRKYKIFPGENEQSLDRKIIKEYIEEGNKEFIKAFAKRLVKINNDLRLADIYAKYQHNVKCLYQLSQGILSRFNLDDIEWFLKTQYASLEAPYLFEIKKLTEKDFRGYVPSPTSARKIITYKQNTRDH